MLLHVVYHPECPVTGSFVSLVPAAQCSVISEALGHSGGFHEQYFIDLKTAGSHGEYRLNTATPPISNSRYITLQACLGMIAHLP